MLYTKDTTKAKYILKQSLLRTHDFTHYIIILVPNMFLEEDNIACYLEMQKGLWVVRQTARRFYQEDEETFSDKFLFNESQTLFCEVVIWVILSLSQV